MLKHNRRTATLLAVLFVVAGPTTVSFAAGSGDADEIVFAVRQLSKDGHWYANFGHFAFDKDEKAYAAMGRLCRLNVETGDVQVLVDDLDGTVRDPQVHYDGHTILFSYRPGGTEHFHLYEINADGTGMRRLTDGPFDDIEPTYLADGQIMFCSSRCRRWVNCYITQVAILHTCDADGQNIRPISANIEQDNTPWPMPGGQVLYTRWEYVDRSRVAFHHLWTANPDGTGQMIFYGNMHPRTLMIDAKPIPGTDGQVVAIFSPKHGRKEHTGAVAVVTPKRGPDDEGSAREINAAPEFRDPYPLTADRFLVAHGSKIAIMDDSGETRAIYQLPQSLVDAGAECHEPRPLGPRPREQVIPRRVDADQPTGRLVLQDIYEGRRMEGVRRGEIKKLLVLETLPKPINFSGKMIPMSFGGTYTLERVVGTVPVEPDGSAYLELPALRPFFFVALDENDKSVKRMHSFLTVMPGETVGCVGCHEQRVRSVLSSSMGSGALALQRPPSRVKPIAGVPDVIDFPRDVQPILNRHCVECHDYDRRDGSLVLSGDRGPVFSHSYYTLTALGYVSDGRDRLVSNAPPRSVGTSASRLMELIDGSHYDARLSTQEQDVIRYWIESAATYPGTYAALGTGMIGALPRSKLDTSDRQWPESVAAADAIRRRCLGCHQKEKPLPEYLSDNLKLVLSNPDFSDVRVRFSRHLLFNLSRPEKSLMLLAPLAHKAGGYETCREKSAGDVEPKPVFTDTADPDYQSILTLCDAGRRHLDEIKRFDMPGFRPAPMYVDQMKRFGVLPSDLADDGRVDVYATDEAYWRLHWLSLE